MAEMNVKIKFLRLLLISVVMTLLVSCGGSGSDSNNSSNLKIGVAQKGPLIIGSEVDITELNSSGLSIRETFKSKITNKNGKFSFSAESINTNSYYRLLVKGVFFDEHLGSNSDDQITLSALTNDPSNISINVLTHWLSQRIDTLLANKTLEVSIKQSQTELTKLFNIENTNSLDISTSSNQLAEDNVMLLLLSGALMEASHKYKMLPQTIINEIGYDFADDGLLNEKGDEWFIRLQALIKDNPKRHTKTYANVISEMLGYKTVSEQHLPSSIPLASRPAAIVPPVYFAAPSETLTLDGSESHDSGEIINFTWFRVDQQTQYDIQVSEKFSASPQITVPNEAAVLAAPDQEIILLYALVVTDAEKLTHTAIVKVIIRIPIPGNEPPIAIPQVDDQSVITDEDTPVNITLDGNDPDGDDINFIINTPLLLPNGLLEGTAPNLTFTPTANFNGTDHFNFQVDDGSLTSASARVNIIVLPVNDPPVADDKTVITNEDTPINITLTGRDEIENDPLNFNLEGITVQNGTLLGVPPNLVYNPNTDFNGNDSFNFTVNDGIDTSALALVNIRVLPVDDNTPPTAIAGDNQTFVAIRQDLSSGFDFGESTMPISLDGSASFDNEDAPDDLTYSWIKLSGPDTMVPDIESDAQPNPFIITGLNQAIDGVYVFQLRVTDTEGLFSEDQVTITVTPANLAPTANAGEDISTVTVLEEGIPVEEAIREGTSVQLDGSGLDPEDGTNVTYEWTAPTEINLNDNTLANPTFTAPAVGATTKVFTLSLIVRDTQGVASETNTVDVTVMPTPPFAYAGTDQIVIYPPSAEGITVSIDDSFGFDPNGAIDKSDLTYLWEVVTLPPTYSGLTLNPNIIGDKVSFNASGTGTITLSLTVTDADGLTDTSEVSIIIKSQLSANNIDTCYPFFNSIDDYDVINIVLTGFDPEGGSLTFSIETLPLSSIGVLDVPPGIISGNSVMFDPAPIGSSSTTNTSFTYIVIDEQDRDRDSEPATVNIGVCSS